MNCARFGEGFIGAYRTLLHLFAQEGGGREQRGTGGFLGVVYLWCFKEIKGDKWR